MVADLAELVDPALADWIDRRRSRSSPPWSTGSRPGPRPDDRRAVADAHRARRLLPGRHRAVPRVGAQRRLPRRPAGTGTRPAPRSPTTSSPYEHRKLWLLNGAHSLLAYAGSARGHQTVAEAVADDACRELDAAVVGRGVTPPRPAGGRCSHAYRDALLDRFANPRMHHRLAQIAADGSQKLPVRILPVLRARARRRPDARRARPGRWPPGSCHLRGRRRARCDDVRADQMVALAGGPLPDAVRRVLDASTPRVGSGRRAGEGRARRTPSACRPSRRSRAAADTGGSRCPRSPTSRRRGWTARGAAGEDGPHRS